MAKLQIVPAGFWESIEKPPGIFRTSLATGDRVMMFTSEYKAGVESTPHAHDNEQIGYVLRGEIDVIVGDQSYTCKAGDTYAIPGKLLHNVRARTDALVIDAFDR